MLSDVEQVSVDRFIQDVGQFNAVKKAITLFLADCERLGVALEIPNETVGENAKAALISEKRIEDAFAFLASQRDTYTQDDEPGHV
jgi:hypothetical protein